MKFFKKNARMQQADVNQARRFTLGQYIAAVSALLLSITAVSFATSTFTTFQGGNVILASEVNANFQNLNDQIASLAAAVSNVQATATLDATTKANNVLAAAALDATTKANNAQAAAISKELGNGQTWQDVMINRAFNTPYTNTTGRTIFVNISGTSGNNPELLVCGVAVGRFGTGLTVIYAPVPNGCTYGFNNTGGTFSYWAELR